MRTRAVWLCGIVALVMQAVPLAALPSPRRLGAPQAVAAASGVFDPFVPGGSYEVGAEFRFAPRRFRFLPERLPPASPTMGIIADAQGSLYVYGGWRLDFPFGARWVVSPGWAVGLYDRAPEFDLGGLLEFRTNIELAYRLPNGSRVGLCLYHLSNGGLYARNPGSESLVVSYSAGLRQ